MGKDKGKSAAAADDSEKNASETQLESSKAPPPPCNPNPNLAGCDGSSAAALKSSGLKPRATFVGRHKPQSSGVVGATKQQQKKRKRKIEEDEVVEAEGAGGGGSHRPSYFNPLHHKSAQGLLYKNNSYNWFKNKYRAPRNDKDDKGVTYGGGSSSGRLASKLTASLQWGKTTRIYHEGGKTRNADSLPSETSFHGVYGCETVKDCPAELEVADFDSNFYGNSELMFRLIKHWFNALPLFPSSNPSSNPYLSDSIEPYRVHETKFWESIYYDHAWQLLMDQNSYFEFSMDIFYSLQERVNRTLKSCCSLDFVVVEGIQMKELDVDEFLKQLVINEKLPRPKLNVTPLNNSQLFREVKFFLSNVFPFFYINVPAPRNKIPLTFVPNHLGVATRNPKEPVYVP